MRNESLAADYLERSNHRLAAVEVLAERESWADVVRESQEIVELSLKALLRIANIEVPRIHDVSAIVLAEIDRLPASMREHAPRLAKISHTLRRDRELSFYGSEDLTPSEFYEAADGRKALEDVRWVVGILLPLVR